MKILLEKFIYRVILALAVFVIIYPQNSSAVVYQGKLANDPAADSGTVYQGKLANTPTTGSGSNSSTSGGLPGGGGQIGGGTGGIGSPGGGISNPLSNISNPTNGMSNPIAGMQNPANALGGMQNPMSGMTAPSMPGMPGGGTGGGSGGDCKSANDQLQSMYEQYLGAKHGGLDDPLYKQSQTSMNEQNIPRDPALTQIRQFLTQMKTRCQLDYRFRQATPTIKSGTIITSQFPGSAPGDTELPANPTFQPDTNYDGSTPSDD